MVFPPQLTNPNFNQAGKNAYKVSEVDEYVRNVRQSYAKLYSDYKVLFDKVSKMTPQVEEYNKIKNSIASALIVAESTAKEKIAEVQAKVEEMVSEAKLNAEALYQQKKAEGEAYYAEKVSEADERVELARQEYESYKERSKELSEKYVAEINLKAEEIIKAANTRAEEIVSAACFDAAKAKEKSDENIAQANSQLNNLKAEAMQIKSELIALVANAQDAVEKVKIRIFDPVESEPATVEAEVTAAQIDLAEIERFTLDFDDIEAPQEQEAPAEEVPLAERSFARFFAENKSPEASDMFSGIFASASVQRPVDTDADSEANAIFADPPGRENTRVFNPLKKDSE